jgi:SET domain
MNQLATIPELIPSRIEAVEAKLLGLEQLDCPVTHRFGGGVYIREVKLSSGMLAIGHHHKTSHMNVMLTGRATFLLPDGTTEEFIAPRVSLWPPGRKIAIVHEDMIWQNIFPTNQTDPGKLEEELLEKSDAFLNDQRERQRIECFQREMDRQDFQRAIAELGFREEEVRRISENTSDLAPLPDAVDSPVIIARSNIQGQGVIATRNIAAGQLIGFARTGNLRTPLGRYCNHAAKPNARMIDCDDKIALVALCDIAGSRGGQPGEEITVDYRQVAQINLPKEQLCQP